MHASFEPAKGAGRTTRAERYGDAAWWPAPPDEHLAGLFFESGLYLRGFDSPSPLTWQELQAFIALNSLELAQWEVKALMKMSRSYCSWLSKADDPRCDPPIEPDDADVIEAIQARNREILKLQMKSAVVSKKPR
jgi:hypothetical protein